MAQTEKKAPDRKRIEADRWAGSFRLMELVRHLIGGRPLTAAEKTGLKNGIQRAMACDDLVTSCAQLRHGIGHSGRGVVRPEEMKMEALFRMPGVF